MRGPLSSFRSPLFGNGSPGSTLRRGRCSAGSRDLGNVVRWHETFVRVLRSSEVAILNDTNLLRWFSNWKSFYCGSICSSVLQSSSYKFLQVAILLTIVSSSL